MSSRVGFAMVAGALTALALGSGGLEACAPASATRAAAVTSPDEATRRDEDAGHLREPAEGASPISSESGARLVPAALQEARFWGAEPGGASRAIISGVRFVTLTDGTTRVATDRLPGMPASVIELPQRLGGGFLFAIGRQIWRADQWLAPAIPIHTAAQPFSQVLVGLDRVYLRHAQGMLDAMDARSGAPLDLGPLPVSPHFGRVVARDAWRALVISDLRGVMVTSDAGSTWRPVALPLLATEAEVAGDAFAVAAPDANKRLRWWRVGADGQAEGLTSSPLQPPAVPPPLPLTAQDPRARSFAPTPLEAAIEDGWPLDDGTALVARDGALGRVRLADGGLVDVAPRAFPLAPSRCHAISLARASDPAAFGFACGEARGPTRIYRWSASRGELEEIHRFDDPRMVLAFGNGAIAASGPCDHVADVDGRSPDRSYCVMSAEGEWREHTVAGPGADRARVVALADGRLAVVWPPTAGELGTARLSVEGEGGRPPSVVPLRIPPLRPESARAVSLGTWLNGFEERRAGVLGGWVDAAGAVVGVEITLEGDLRVGEYIRDAGSPVVSGRWAFGWTASRRGFETTDGGMTWSKDLSLPDRIEQPARTRSRACGPIGCAVAGWLRVGWGGAGDTATPMAPPAPRPVASAGSPRWRLRCAPLAPPQGPPLANAAARAAGATHASGWGITHELTAMPGGGPPPLPPDDVGLTAEAALGFERSIRGAPLARLFAWGPSTGDWDALGRWQIRWDWAWGSHRDARATAPSAGPWPSLDAARHALGAGGGATTTWIVAAGDDADHALLVGRHPSTPATTELVLLEADAPAVFVQHPGGDAFPEVESALRAGGRWYVATAEGPAEPPATVVWELDGAIARERARVPRAGFEARPAARLARRADGRSIGLVVDGQPDIGRPAGAWAVGIDLEAGTTSDPEPIAALGSHPSATCAPGDDAGWQLDAAYPGSIELEVGRWSAGLQGAVVHLRATRDRVCIDRALGAVEPYAAAPPPPLVAGAPGGPAGPAESALPASWMHALGVSVFSGRSRYALRCATTP